MSFQFATGRKINILEQDLNELTIRHEYGGMEASSSAERTLWANSTTYLLEYTGKGYFYYAQFRVNPATRSDEEHPRIDIDSQIIQPYGNFYNHHYHGADTSTMPLRLLSFAEDGFCCVEYFFNPPLKFDTSLKIGFYNPSDTNHRGYINYFYTKL